VELVSIIRKGDFRVTRAWPICPFLLMLAAVCFAQVKPENSNVAGYRVEGRVTDWVTGKGIEAATVSATDSHKNTHPTLTMADGSYRLDGLPREAKLTVTCSQLGYSPNPREAVIEIRSGIGKWDTRLFKENGGEDYLKAAAGKISLLSGSDRIVEAKFVADNADAISKKIIATELQQKIHAGQADQGLADMAELFNISGGNEDKLQRADWTPSENATQEASLQAQQAARNEAEARAAQAETAADKARANQDAAQQQAYNAADQTDQMRQHLEEQLNAVLATRETARGLIVNLSDVLFDFNKSTLKPAAREKLAKVSGILSSYPNLKLQIEGFADNVGSDEYNQKLSEERADAVRDYLVTQGVPQTNISAAGYGKSNPVADNSTAAGRAENRRVQVVVSGGAIGVQETPPSP
jgi:outer membrane protein OmpA-like peptidoglycan-associated protein